MTDDGNLQSALAAGVHDLLDQTESYSQASIWSCFLVLHTDNLISRWIIDPTFEELNNLSNNLLLVTIIVGSCGERLIVEKGLDDLRTSFSVQ